MVKFNQIIIHESTYNVSSDGTWYEQINSAASKTNRVLGLIKNTFSSWSDEIAKIRQTTPRIRFISLELTSRIRLKNIRKCPAKNIPHERIASSSLRNETRKTRFG